jgi:hypothetical protein
MWRILPLLLLCLADANGTLVRVWADEPPKQVVSPAPSQAEIEHWIADLNAPEFAIREQATEQLQATGTAAVEPLLKAAPACGLEASVRITAILRSWYTSGREELIDAAETTLEALSESKNRHLAGRSDAVLKQFSYTIRHERALAQIEKLGGRIKFIERGPVRAPGPEDFASYLVILGSDWRGGEEGLKHVQRLAGLDTLYLLRDRTTRKILTPGISDNAVENLQKAMPRLNLQYRGPAFLGISPDPNWMICAIKVVESESPAEKAKLMPGDVITKFNGQPVRNFEKLVDEIADKQPGNVVNLEILRGVEEDLRAFERLQARKGPGPDELLEGLRKRLAKEVSVTLGEWGGK